MQRLIALGMAAAPALGVLLIPALIHQGSGAVAVRNGSGPKYVFLLMADGGGIPQMEITRMFNRVVNNEGFTITDKIIKEGSVGLVTTHPADLLSTDSAAAATALAGG